MTRGPKGPFLLRPRQCLFSRRKVGYPRNISLESVNLDPNRTSRETGTGGTYPFGYGGELPNDLEQIPRTGMAFDQDTWSFSAG